MPIALSIRQPWAWLILHGGKDIENRGWQTNVRGRVLIHAAKGMTHDEWSDAWAFARGSGANLKAIEADVTFRNIARGGIVGSVEICDCVTASSSRWFVGRFGFVLRNPKPLPFIPWRGSLGFFAVPQAVMEGDLTMTPQERAVLIDRLDRSFRALPDWVKAATKHAMGAPTINPETGKPFASFREVISVASDHTLEILRDDFEGDGDLLP